MVQRFYLQRPDGTVSDIGHYPGQPDNREDGEWVEGVPPADAPRPKSKEEQTAEIRAQMDASYKSMPLDLRRAFAPLLAASYVAANIGDYELAADEIQRADLSGIADPNVHDMAVEAQAAFLQAVQSIEAIQ